MRITNFQKKELSDIFKRNGLNVVDFETSGEYQEFIIKFKYDYFSFTIVKVKDDVYSLSILAIDRKNPHSSSENWGNLITKFDNWTKQVSRELVSPTGWESFENTNFLNAEFGDLNTSFNETEKIQTKQSILELKEKILLLNLPPNKLEIIENKLDNLTLKVDELNKFDWKSLFIGTIASLIMTLVIPPEASGILWEYIKSSFNNLKIKA